MLCEKYDACGFIKVYKDEPFMEKYTQVYCAKEKQENCARKQFFLKNSYPPPDNLTPQGHYLLSKD